MGCTTPPGQLEGGCKRSHSFVAAAGKTCLVQKSKGFGHGVVVAANQWRTVEIELLASVGWKWGCQPCSWPMLAKWDALPKGDLSLTNLLKKSIPAIPSRNSKHPLPGRSNFLRTAARSTSSASGLQKIPSLRCSCWKNLSYDIVQKSRGFGHEVAVSKMCCNAVLVLSVVLCDCCKP